MHDLFLTHIARSYEYDREYVTACEGNPHSLQTDRGYIYHLAQYMFSAGCRIHKNDQFTKFIGCLAAVDWSLRRAHLTFIRFPVRATRH
jgi:hypothetical protein